MLGIFSWSHFEKPQTNCLNLVDKEYGRKSSELYEKFSRNICSKQDPRRCFQSSRCYQSSTQVQNNHSNCKNHIFVSPRSLSRRGSVDGEEGPEADVVPDEATKKNEGVDANELSAALQK